MAFGGVNVCFAGRMSRSVPGQAAHADNETKDPLFSSHKKKQKAPAMDAFVKETGRELNYGFCPGNWIVVKFEPKETIAEVTCFAKACAVNWAALPSPKPTLPLFW